MPVVPPVSTSLSMEFQCQGSSYDLFENRIAKKIPASSKLTEDLKSKDATKFDNSENNYHDHNVARKDEKQINYNSEENRNFSIKYEEGERDERSLSQISDNADVEDHVMLKNTNFNDHEKNTDFHKISVNFQNEKEGINHGDSTGNKRNISQNINQRYHESIRDLSANSSEDDYSSGDGEHEDNFHSNEAGIESMVVESSPTQNGNAIKEVDTNHIHKTETSRSMQIGLITELEKDKHILQSAYPETQTTDKHMIIKHYDQDDSERGEDNKNNDKLRKKTAIDSQYNEDELQCESSYFSQNEHIVYKNDTSPEQYSDSDEEEMGRANVPTPVDIQICNVMRPLDGFAERQGAIHEKKYAVLPSIGGSVEQENHQHKHKKQRKQSNTFLCLNQLDYTRDHIEEEADFFSEYRINSSEVKVTPRSNPLPPIKHGNKKICREADLK